MHRGAVEYLLKRDSNFIKRVDNEFVNRYIIDGRELDLDGMDPVMRQVGCERDAELFRWVKFHWSIPVSSGYGRRLRYLVFNNSNNALIGIIGLGDPVYSLRARDTYIGWDKPTKARNLKHVMDAFVLGAVPPYSLVLGGKLVAALAASPTVRRDFEKKYANSKTRISGETFDGRRGRGLLAVPRLLEEPAHQPLHLPPPRRRRGDAEPLGAQHTLLDERGKPDLGDAARSHVLGEAAYEPLVRLR